MATASIARNQGLQVQWDAALKEQGRVVMDSFFFSLSEGVYLHITHLTECFENFIGKLEV